MSHSAFAVAFAIFIWWFSTGVVFVIARKGERHEWAVAFGATVLAVLALAGLFYSAHWDTVVGAYVAFCSALVVWAWHELMFLFGFIAGPRRVSATTGLSGGDRFREAFATVRDHELAIAATAVLIVFLTIGASNVIGLWTFTLLWVMRVSAKLSIYLGARNSLSEMMPARLVYLNSYFRTDRTTWFLPFVIAIGSAVFVLLCIASSAASDAHGAVGFALLASLLGLALLEHVFLMLPIRDAALWLWAAPSAKKTNSGNVRDASPGDRADAKTLEEGGVSWT